MAIQVKQWKQNVRWMFDRCSVNVELSDRLPAVPGVIHPIFNEGYSATAGEDWMRPSLCDGPLRPGRILAGIVPGDPEVNGLLALMELQASV